MPVHWPFVQFRISLLIPLCSRQTLLPLQLQDMYNIHLNNRRSSLRSPASPPSSSSAAAAAEFLPLHPSLSARQLVRRSFVCPYHGRPTSTRTRRSHKHLNLQTRFKKNGQSGEAIFDLAFLSPLLVSSCRARTRRTTHSPASSALQCSTCRYHRSGNARERH